MLEDILSTHLVISFSECLSSLTTRVPVVARQGMRDR